MDVCISALEQLEGWWMRSQAGAPLGLAPRARVMVHRSTSREEELLTMLA